MLLLLESLLLLAAPLSAAQAAVPPAAAGGAPGVLVIAIDALRADRVHALGYDRATTPVLDTLASEGTLFRQCMSTAPWLLPAHVSLLTGCDPNVARRALDKSIERQVERNWHVPARVPHAAVEWLTGGHATAAFLDHPWISELYGMHVGFSHFDARESTSPPRGLEHNAAALLGWLRELPREQAWFAYLHVHDLERIWSEPDPMRDSLFPPRQGGERVPAVSNEEPCFHAIPPSRWDGGRHTLGEYQARYDGALHQLDERLGRLFAELRAMNRMGTTTIAVVGSFGLQFGEAGLYLDHGGLSVADLHVPLLIRPAPAQDRARGRAIDEVVSSADLAPTLLELGGLPVPAGMHGVSLARWLAREAPPPDAPREYAIATCGLQQGYVLFGRQWVLEILFPGETSSPSLVRSWFGDSDLEGRRSEYRERVYDRFATPVPAWNHRSPPPAEVLDRIKQHASRWVLNIDQMRRVLHTTGLRRDVTPEQIRELVRLGYLGSDWAPAPVEQR
ncbi:MAG: sulfatase [Planctomycetes bacterium]|nr:sulfatase [Planctomycetota bacterium]